MSPAGHGLRVEITSSTEALMKHLKSGKPAFLDVAISREPQRLAQTGAPGNERLTSHVFFPVHHSDPKYFGWHSVLALGVIETGPVKGKILIMDSAFGREVQL